MLDNFRLTRPVMFYALSYLLDEVSTLIILATGGVELNPIIAWMIGVHPLLYTMCDFTIFLSYCATDSHLRDKVSARRIDLFWLIGGSARFSLFLWNVWQILSHIRLRA